ncbi:MAG: polysaccharide deacetylase family protein [Erythrobacter sp.]|uniref:polysaccharide deacetylase family protein n=1 Tax=Erythrobacter sp. TaxID=1042 RepID=UPI003263B814
MSLDPEYLIYLKRREGMDHDFYPYSNFFTRPKTQWANGEKLLIWPVVSLEYFPMVPSDDPFRAPGHMQTAYPDYRHYTAREYGTRIGIYRLLDAFEKCGITISIAMNAAVAERYPELAGDIISAGHEIIAHSVDMNGTIAGGMDEEVERRLIIHSFDTIEKATGQRPRGWLSIARSQSFNTPWLLVEAGAKYMCDWGNDEVPNRFDTQSGPTTNIPLNHELSDRQIINVQQHSIDSFAEQIRDGSDWLLTEAGEHGGRLLLLQLTPYISGLPFRIGVLERLIADLSANPDIRFATGASLLKQWESSCS